MLTNRTKVFIKFLKLEIPSIIQIQTFYAFLVFIFRDSLFIVVFSPLIINFLLGSYFWEKAHTFVKDENLNEYALEAHIGITCIIFMFVSAISGFIYSISK